MCTVCPKKFKNCPLQFVLSIHVRRLHKSEFVIGQKEAFAAFFVNC